MCYYTLQVNSFINDGKKKEEGFTLPLIAFSYSVRSSRGSHCRWLMRFCQLKSNDLFRSMFLSPKIFLTLLFNYMKYHSFDPSIVPEVVWLQDRMSQQLRLQKSNHL